MQANFSGGVKNLARHWDCITVFVRLSNNAVFSIFPHVDLDAREKHREEIMNDPEWREACKLQPWLKNMLAT
jgi:hypothetical protein